MSVICPTVTATGTHEYRVQMERLVSLTKRVHIDLMDGKFAPTTSPGLDQIWWPEDMTADIHLMYQKPMTQIDQLIHLKPHLVIIHEEADVDYRAFADQMHQNLIKVGLALLQNTPAEQIRETILSFDHVLVFSGDLGRHGGRADMRLLEKVSRIREYHPAVEIGWDGGISEENAEALITGGVDVLNVGGFIQNATDPASAYATLKAIR
jgi:ribulose-phosphate 3-epimerase